MKCYILILILFFTTGVKGKIKKDQWLIGGNGLFSHSNSNEIKTISFQLSPGIGYFFKDKFAGALDWVSILIHINQMLITLEILLWQSAPFCGITCFHWSKKSTFLSMGLSDIPGINIRALHFPVLINIITIT